MKNKIGFELVNMLGQQNPIPDIALHLVGDPVVQTQLPVQQIL
jgi:hypothetical protein